MAIKILVIEDDTHIQELICEFLKTQQYDVHTADDGVEGYEKFKKGSYDLIILDVMMPRMDGFSLCQIIRNEGQVPVIVLTALNEEEDQIKAFELEADDFVTKPFSFNVLVKRVEAVLRRTGHGSKKQVLQHERLTLDREQYQVYVDDVPIEVTAKEFEIVKVLLENIDKVMTRELLLDHIWGYDYFGDTRIVDAHIKNIRKKLNLPYIQTVKGIGYTIRRSPV